MKRLAFALTLLAAANAHAQFAGNVIVPQSRSVVMRPSAAQVSIGDVGVEIDVVQRIAVTALTIHLLNPSAMIQESELLVPVPDDAIVRSFDFEGKAAEPTAKVLPKAEARATYEKIVAKVRDPALLEFAGHATVRSSVFPVPAHGKQTVKLVYEHVLPADGDRIDYELVRSEALQACFVPWRVEVRIRAKEPISTVYSPTHEFKQIRASENEVRLRLDIDAAREPGPIDFSFLLQGDGVNGTFFAYPDLSGKGDDGWFLMLGGVPVKRDALKEKSRKREVIVVLDRSGSMAGKKIEQARAAAMQVLSGLDEGERFNIVDYSDQVACFSAEPVAMNAQALDQAKAYLARLPAAGGTNLNGALMFALKQPCEASQIPIVLFLTDGLPTVGETSEVAIRDAAVAANANHRRLFTVGVGDDVNAPLLDHIASHSRATSAYVRPEENVEKKVSEVFAKLKGPILASPRLAVLDVDGKPADQRVADLLPSTLPDLYDGDELLVTGRYRGQDPLLVEIAGDYLGEAKAFRFRLVPDQANLQSSFVPRLWASRRIGELVDQLRQSGAAPANGSTPHGEVADEVFRLSREFGVMTEYTAFLALEGTNLAADGVNINEMNRQIDSRLKNVRSGRAAIAQSTNTRGQATQQRSNRRNRMVSSTLEQVEVAGVAQIGDRAFYRRGGAWVDSRLPRTSEPAKPDEVVAFGTPRHDEIVSRLLSQGRQGVIALHGDVVMEIDGKAVLLSGPAPAAKAQPAPAPASGAPPAGPPLADKPGPVK